MQCIGGIVPGLNAGYLLWEGTFINIPWHTRNNGLNELFTHYPQTQDLFLTTHFT